MTTRRNFVKLAGALAVMAAGPRAVQAAAEPSGREPGGHRAFDLVVYGSTPGGICASIAAARAGLRVALISQGSHVGGMVASGLSATDRGNIETIGGICREFFERVGRHYNERIEWDFEPHVAEETFQGMLRDAHIAVFSNAQLRPSDGVTKQGTRIDRITLEDGSSFSAPVFVDSSYEGDLMAQAGVSFMIGREASSKYNESWAGVLPHNRCQPLMDHQFMVKVSPHASDGSLLPLVSSAPRGSVGDGDKKLPAYNYRLCFTADKTNQVPYWKPDGYDPKEYELLARYLQKRHSLGYTFKVTDLVLATPLRNSKLDINNHGPISTDYINESWSYPAAGYERRREIARAHQRYEAGFFYFLAHDPRVPSVLQAEFRLLGPCRDEFTDTDHWPWQIYIREARRMISDFVTTQKDCLTDVTKPDSIGMGSYNMDSHNVQRIPSADGGTENEGDLEVPTTPWEIPYRCLQPRREEATNLLVSVCPSFSHVAYGSFREEPACMIAGQAAGIAAAIAMRGKIPVQDVPVPELQKQLTAGHAILRWHGFTPPRSADISRDISGPDVACP